MVNRNEESCPGGILSGRKFINCFPDGIKLKTMKNLVKLGSIFLGLALISSCSLQDDRLLDSGLEPENSFAGGSYDLSQDVKGRYIIVFKDVVSDPSNEANIMARRFGLEMGHVYEHVFNGFSARVPEQALNGLRNHPLIAFIEPDLVMHSSTQTIPTGIRRMAADENATAAIDGQEGEIVDPSGNTVDAAVIDTGIDKEHPELIVKGGVRFYNGRFTDSNYDDDNGHGSHVAGTIGARDNNDGVVGVAPGASLYAVKVLNSRGSGYLSDIIKGLDWVRSRSNEIEVINMSLGGQGLSSTYRTAIQNCVSAGIVVIVAAGNESSDVYGSDGVFGTSDDIIPAAYPEAAAISALADTDGEPGGTGPATSYGADDSFASFSNFSRSVVTGNPVTSPGAAIDLILPGVNILSCYKDMNYATMSGTSMASPHAAGLAVLYIAQHGRAGNAAGVYTIRQALIDAGKDQVDAEGLKVQNDPDGNKEKLGWAGTGSPAINQPPVAAFSFSAPGLTVTFADQSTDRDGYIVSRAWSFGDGAVSDLANPVHTYNSDGTYNVSLTVTDDDGATNSVTKSVTVTTASQETIDLSVVTNTLNKNTLKVTLSWVPGTTAADVYRDGTKIATMVTSPYTSTLKKTGTTHTYKVQSASGTWSNEVTFTF